MRAAWWLVVFGLGCVPKQRHLAEVAALETRIQQIDADRQMGERYLEAANAKAAELSELVTALRASGDDLAAKLAEFDAGLTAMIAENARLQGELNVIRDERAKTQAERDELAADRARTQAERDALAERVAALKVSMGNAEAQVRDAEGRIQQLALEKAALEAAKNELEAKTAAYDELVSSLQSEIAAGQITISELSGKLTVNLSNAILFDSGKYALRPEGVAALKKVATVLAKVTDRTIQVEGHTDNDAVRPGGVYADNWALSSLRASTVVGLLVAEGVDPLAVAAVGYGEHRPVAPNADATGKASNRRTEIVLTPKLAR